MRTIIAIDPGANGGVAFYNDRDGIYRANDLMPLSDLLDDLDILFDAGADVIFVVEDVPPFTGNMIPGSSAFKMGKRYGLVLGIGMGLRIPTYTIKPKKWQKVFDGLGKSKGPDRKKKLKDICKQLHPEIKVTYNTCDAVLLMHYFIANEHTIK